MFPNRLWARVGAVLLSATLAFDAVAAPIATGDLWSDRARLRTAPSLAPVPVVPPQAKPSQGPADLGKSIPPAFASVRERRAPLGTPSGETVLLIQDVHQNAEAQDHVSALIRHLADHPGGLFVGLEGAWEPIDLNRVRAFPLPSAIRVAADYLLRENRISGAVHGALTDPAPTLTLAGVDDKALYLKHVAAYRASVPLKAALEKKLEEASNAVDQMEQGLSTAIAIRESISRSYRRGEFAMPVYLEKLLELRGGNDKNRLPAGYPELAKLREAHQLESTLDFGRAEIERAAILKRLAARLDADGARRLVDLAASYRVGRISHRDFYTALADAFTDNGLSLSEAPLFSSYLRYTALADRLSAEKMTAEMTRLEAALLNEAKPSRDDRAVLALAERVELMRRLKDQALTPDDWRRYLDLKAASRGRNPLLPSAADLRPFEAFFEVAHERDAALAKNLLLRMRAAKAKSAVIVAGGFHARGLTDRLSAAGVTVISAVPNLTRADPGEATTYLTWFSREKTPLDRLFAGRRLYLPTPPAQLGLLPELTVMAAEAADPKTPLRRVSVLISALRGRPVKNVSSRDTATGVALDTDEGSFTAAANLSAVTFRPSLVTSLGPQSIFHPLVVLLYQRAMTRASDVRSRQIAIAVAFTSYVVIAGPYLETVMLSFLTSTLASGLAAGALFVLFHVGAIVATRFAVGRLYDGRAIVPTSIVSDMRDPVSIGLYLTGSALVAAPFLLPNPMVAFAVSFGVHAFLNALYVMYARILAGRPEPSEPMTEIEEITAGLGFARLSGRIIEDLQEDTGKDIDHPKRRLVSGLLGMQERARSAYEAWVAGPLRRHEAVRVLQWNLLDKPSPQRWALQKQRFATLVAKGRPHIVTLQEVSPGDEMSAAAEMAAQNGYAVYEAMPRRGSGIAILYDTSFDLEESWTDELRPTGSGKVIGVRLRSKENGKIVNVVTAKLAWQPGALGDRERQRRQIDEEMRRRAAPDEAVIVTGDFNPSGEEELARGMADFPGYADTFRETNPGMRGLTYAMANSLTKNYAIGNPELQPSKRLDVVLSRNAAPVDSRLAFNERPFTSDHFAIVSDVSLGAPRFDVAPREELTADLMAEARRLVVARVLSPGDAVLLFEGWAAAQKETRWSAQDVERNIPNYFPLLAPRLGVNQDRWNAYAAPARQEPFAQSVWYNNMQPPMEKRLRTRWEALFTARVVTALGREVPLPEYLLDRAREVVRPRYPALERFVPFLSAILRAIASRRVTMENVRLVVHGSFLYADKPNDLDIDVYIAGTSMTRELLAGAKANVVFDPSYGVESLPLHASAFGLLREPGTPSVNDAFLTTAFWNGLPVWGQAVPDEPGVLDRLRSIEEYLGFIEVKRHENRFDKTQGYLIGFLYFLLAQAQAVSRVAGARGNLQSAQSASEDIVRSINKELDRLEDLGNQVTPEQADRIIALARTHFNSLVGVLVDEEGLEVNFRFRGGYVGVAGDYLVTAREKIRRTVYRNLGAWALMRTAIVLYLAVRDTNQGGERTAEEKQLLDLASELDTLRKQDYEAVRARVLAIERQLTDIQRRLADGMAADLTAREKEQWARLEVEIADATQETREKIRRIQEMRAHLQGRKFTERPSLLDEPPAQTKAAPNAPLMAMLFAAVWGLLFISVDPSPAAAFGFLVSPIVATLLFALYGRALNGALGPSTGFIRPDALARFVSDRFGLTLTIVSESDWLDGAMTSPYAEIRGDNLFIRERASRNLLSLAFLIAHEARGERPLSRGPSFLFTSPLGRFVREAVATALEFAFFLPTWLALLRLAREAPVSAEASRDAERLESVADEVFALARARVAGRLIDGQLPGTEVVSWDIGGAVAGTEPAGPLSVAALERLPAVLNGRLDAQARAGTITAPEAAAMRAAIADWLGRPVAVDGKTFEFIARRSDLTDAVLARLATRRAAGLTDTIYVDAAELAANAAFFEGLRGRGLNVQAVAGLINGERKEIETAALAQVIRGWDAARRGNAILTFSGELSFAPDADPALARLVSGVSVVTIEALVAAIASGLRSVPVLSLDVLIQGSRLSAIQA